MKTTITMEFGPEDNVEEWFAARENDQRVHRAWVRFGNILKREITELSVGNKTENAERIQWYEDVIRQFCACLGEECAYVNLSR